MSKKKLTLSMLDSSLESSKNQITDLVEFQLASLLAHFQIGELKILVLNIFNKDLSDLEMKRLLIDCNGFSGSKQFVLQDQMRVKVLKHLRDKGKLQELIAKIEQDGVDSSQQLVFQYLKGVEVNLADLNIDQLAFLSNVISWLKEVASNVPSMEDINRRIKQQELLVPLRQRTQDFIGREVELQFLHRFVNKEHSLQGHPLLLIDGIGGIGKSSLVSKYILQELSDGSEKGITFAYFDFDRIEYTVSQPLQLVLEALRQLSLQSPFYEMGSILSDVANDLKSFFEGTLEIPRGDGPPIPPTITIQGFFDKLFLDKKYQDLHKLHSPILIVLDSFEEEQYSSSSAGLYQLFVFLEDLKKYVPGLRFIIIGRGLISINHELEILHLQEFDKPAAKAYFSLKGIKQVETQEALYDQFGGNPLILNLAASVLQQIGGISSIKPNALDGIFGGINKDTVQIQLLKRNLDHIHDSRVRKIAFGGFILRRVSPEVIRHVLALPCGLGQIDILESNQIFALLKKEQYLVEEVDGELMFRKDLRVALRELVIKERPIEAKNIQDLAVTYYADSVNPLDQADYLYHRLMRGDDPKIIDEFYHESLRPYLEIALSELPLNARIHLAKQMGRS